MKWADSFKGSGSKEKRSGFTNFEITGSDSGPLNYVLVLLTVIAKLLILDKNRSGPRCV